jgi:hypothetical protein
MAAVKSSGRPANKAQGAKKHASVRKSKAKTRINPAPAKGGKKRIKAAAKCSSLKAKQLIVDKVKRLIWSSLQPITEAIIIHAETGNLAAAKELFDFAGVYALPMPDDENVAAGAAPVPVPAAITQTPAAKPALVHPIDLFFDKVGVPPSTATKPETEVA